MTSRAGARALALGSLRSRAFGLRAGGWPIAAALRRRTRATAPAPRVRGRCSCWPNSSGRGRGVGPRTWRRCLRAPGCWSRSAVAIPTWRGRSRATKKHELNTGWSRAGCCSWQCERHYLPKGFGDRRSRPSPVALRTCASPRRRGPGLRASPARGARTTRKERRRRCRCRSGCRTRREPRAGGATHATPPCQPRAAQATLRSMLSGARRARRRSPPGRAPLDDPLRGLEPSPLRRPGHLDTRAGRRRSARARRSRREPAIHPRACESSASSCAT